MCWFASYRKSILSHSLGKNDSPRCNESFSSLEFLRNWSCVSKYSDFTTEEKKVIVFWAFCLLRDRNLKCENRKWRRRPETRRWERTWYRSQLISQQTQAGIREPRGLSEPRKPTELSALVKPGDSSAEPTEHQDDSCQTSEPLLVMLTSCKWDGSPSGLSPHHTTWHQLP